VSRFLAGFLTASVLWGVGVWLFLEGVFESGQPELAMGAPPDAGIEEASEEDSPRRRRRGRRRGASGGGAVPTGIATTGDDLGADDPRMLDMAEGGEEQLPSSEIERAMDEAFGRIRRCLVLAAGDDPVTGRLTFGLRIEPNGSISRVNLRGPAAVTTGDAGDCLRQAVRQVRFRSFSGPAMVVHYPVTLD
jgi:hypothetical protein